MLRLSFRICAIRLPAYSVQEGQLILNSNADVRWQNTELMGPGFEQ
jgi:hypothetical protein